MKFYKLALTIPVLMGGLLFNSCSENKNQESTSKNKIGIEKIVSDGKMPQKELWSYIPKMKKRPSFYDQLSYSQEKTLDESMYKLSNKNSIDGRIQRLARVEELVKGVAEKREIPYEIFASIGSQESYFDPEQLVRKDDGGVGDFHMQSKTAAEYGLKTYSNSKEYKDAEDGKNASWILHKNKGDWKKISSKDERFHKIKNMDAAARILLIGRAKYGTWDNAIKFYRTGDINSDKANDYLKKVKFLQKNLFDEKNISKAKEKFEDLNLCSFETFRKYENIFHSSNWQLDKYMKTKL